MIARVTLDLKVRKEFDYSIPPELAGQVEVGSRVKVPFGARQILGSVTALVETSPHVRLRPILKVIGSQSLLTPKVLHLARWISEYYCAPLDVTLKSALPEAVRKEQKGWRELLFVRVLPAPGELPKLTQRQQDVWNIVEEWHEIPLHQLLTLAETTAATVHRLEEKGLVAIARKISERDPYADELILPTQPLVLNAEQAAALEKIKAAMGSPRVAREECRARVAQDAGATRSTFLLHGVTGSGKTEVYLQAIAHTLAQGKGAIVLVPEISLTPQTVERFKARFSSGPLQTLVAVLHSHLSAGERHDEWHKIRQSRARIVIGARSAVFAPVDPLGLIIVDEEHENSYKQEEAPRYHARDVAVLRGQQEGAVVVLGSATPSLESYYNAQKGKYALLELLSRVDEQKMPIVRVVDMRQEARQEKGIPIFSRLLKEAMTARLEKRANNFSSIAAATRRPCNAPNAATSPAARIAAFRSRTIDARASFDAISAGTKPKRRASVRNAPAAIRQFVMPDWALRKSKTLWPNCFRTRASSGWIPTRSRRKMICAAS